MGRTSSRVPRLFPARHPTDPSSQPSQRVHDDQPGTKTDNNSSSYTRRGGLSWCVKRHKISLVLGTSVSATRAHIHPSSSQAHKIRVTLHCVKIHRRPEDIQSDLRLEDPAAKCYLVVTHTTHNQRVRVHVPTICPVSQLSFCTIFENSRTRDI